MAKIAALIILVFITIFPHARILAQDKPTKACAELAEFSNDQKPYPGTYVCQGETLTLDVEDSQISNQPICENGTCTQVSCFPASKMCLKDDPDLFCRHPSLSEVWAGYFACPPSTTCVVNDKARATIPGFSGKIYFAAQPQVTQFKLIITTGTDASLSPEVKIFDRGDSQAPTVLVPMGRLNLENNWVQGWRHLYWWPKNVYAGKARIPSLSIDHLNGEITVGIRSFEKQTLDPEPWVKRSEQWFPFKESTNFMMRYDLVKQSFVDY